MFRARWMGLPWRRVTVNSRQYSPAATLALSSHSVSSSRVPSVESRALADTITVAAMRMVTTEMSGLSPRPLAK